MMHRALDGQPVNVLLLGKGNTVSADGLAEQALAGAGGFKLHEDWGSTPAAIDACLTAAERFGLQVAIHTDTLNEAGFLESTVAAIAGRGIHAYHTEGAGGGHAPGHHRDRRRSPTCCRRRPTRRGRTRSTRVAEHHDMLIVCHHLNPRVPEDLAFAESRIRASTIAAEDLLHDLGRDLDHRLGRPGDGPRRARRSSAPGRPRTRARRATGALAGDGVADNARARRYVAKYTICPAVAHGIDAHVGSVEVGKLADLVALGPGLLRRAPAAGAEGRGDRLEPDR